MEVRDQGIAHRRCEETRKREIFVRATGEAVCPPDVLEFLVSVSNTKEALESAQESVKRRSEYILQVLRNNGVKDRYIRSTSEVSKGEGSVTVQANVLVRTDCLTRCEKVRNFLIEKLDRSVQFGPIHCSHSLETKENKRQESFQRAVFNAKAKAQSIAQAVGVQLGAATQVIETSQGVAEEPPTTREVLDTVSITGGVQQMYARETLTYTSSVSVTFEAHPVLLRTCTHNKCPKH